MNKLICLTFLIALSLSLSLNHQQEEELLPDGEYTVSSIYHPWVRDVAGSVKITVDKNKFLVVSRCGYSFGSYSRNNL